MNRLPALDALAVVAEVNAGKRGVNGLDLLAAALIEEIDIVHAILADSLIAFIKGRVTDELIPLDAVLPGVLQNLIAPLPELGARFFEREGLLICLLRVWHEEIS